ncbi:hypothetical protein MNBD_CHLOROFLEXI01-3361 [hydrothermal vent metagenome]|uniref:DUF4367 domain-containing protein n=1 Tax=hydrothermal vent metagenome TaxID=652676 RepID=A0A3B0VYT4_9ZZZZ
MNKMTSLQEEQIQGWAASFSYPLTPDIASRLRPLPSTQPAYPNRRLAWVVILLLLTASLLAVPSVRAALVQILRAGGITIFVGEEAATDERSPLLSEQIPLFAEPITLDEALALYSDLQLPAELKPPDDLLLHGMNGWNSAVIFLWRDEAQPDQIGMSLYQINVPQYAYKEAGQLEITEVNGLQAFWIDAPHYFFLTLGNNESEAWSFVPGNVLIWWDGTVTYRLEGANSLEEALRLAESMQEIAPSNE